MLLKVMLQSPTSAPEGGGDRTWGRGCLRLLLHTRNALSDPHPARGGPVHTNPSLG